MAEQTRCDGREPWTQERDALLERLAASGLSAGLIAEEMGITRNAVIGRAWRKGIVLKSEKRKPNPWNESRAADKTPPSLPPPVPPTTTTTEPRCTILDLKSDRCRWPMWGHWERPTVESRYCGGESHGKPYCPYHRHVSERGSVAVSAEAS